jgi:hypothetical protein
MHGDEKIRCTFCSDLNAKSARTLIFFETQQQQTKGLPAEQIIICAWERNNFSATFEIIINIL